ncbi:MAG: CpXC domain-containing protein [Leptospiraceae bacterium]|nr:CpXC domain-containing protein [Leptospiraceae bacterium]MCP5495361.1 CpXC domain-containing protein [Leptospiraceae bacterium]
MSSKRLVEVVCSKCGEQSEFMYWDSINVTVDPELRIEFFNHKINHFDCSHCGNKGLVFEDFIYHDMDSRFIISLLSSDNKDYLEKSKQSLSESISIMQETVNMDGFTTEYKFRIVFNLNQLTEKVNIFESNLDDKIIEILKLFIFRDFVDSKEEIIPEIFFVDILETNEIEFIVLTGGEGNYGVTLKLDTYKNIENQIHNGAFTKLYALNEWEVVDRDFVVDRLN